MKAGEDVSAEEERANSPFLCLFVPFRLSMEYIMSTYIGEKGCVLLNLLIRMLISSRNILTETPQNNVLLAIWALLSPSELTHKINHHTTLP